MEPLNANNVNTIIISGTRYSVSDFSVGQLRIGDVTEAEPMEGHLWFSATFTDYGSAGGRIAGPVANLDAVLS